MVQSNYHTKNTSDIFRKKRKENTLDLIYGLSILGPSTTSEITKFTLQNRLPKHSKIPYRESQTLTGIYYNLIRDRPKNNYNGKILGLLSSEYIRKTNTKINKKQKEIPVYFLTQKGHFFSIGFDFKKNDFTLFLKYASKNNLFFAYMNSINEKTSGQFIDDIFIKPILKLILEQKFDLDNDFNFYFVNIAQAIGNSVYIESSKILEKNNSKKLKEKMKYFQTLIDNTFYNDIFSYEWEESLIEHYYPKDSDQDFYRKNRDESDSQLIYAVFRAIYSAYYNALGFGIPKPKNKIPLPRWLKEHRRRKKGLKNKKIRI